jgi:exopolysaccharide biosynthesis WecB/TagA/CpsF family protein
VNVHAAFAQFGVRSWKTILGVSVASIGWDDAVRLLQRLIEEDRFTRISFLNAHNANLATTDGEFAAALEDFLILPDGIGVDIAARLLYGTSFPANLNGTDFVPGFLRETARPLTVGLIGAKADNVEGAVRNMARLMPRHEFVLVNDGYFTEAEEQQILERIRTLRPDILLVAMGVPRQELWIRRNLTGEHCTLPIAVGALFDFMSGSVPRAPLLVRKLRLEWLFRLTLEPVRLWRRYVVGNPLFIARVLRDKLLGRQAAL